MQRLEDIGSPCSTWEAAGSLSNRMQLEASAQRDPKSSRAGKNRERCAVPRWLGPKPLVITSLSWLSLRLRFMSLLNTMQRGGRFQDLRHLISSLSCKRCNMSIGAMDSKLKA